MKDKDLVFEKISNEIDDILKEVLLIARLDGAVAMTEKILNILEEKLAKYTNNTDTAQAAQEVIKDVKEFLKAITSRNEK